MNNDLSRLLKWFCSKLTYNDLASAVPVLLEILGGTRKDIKLKPDEKPKHYRDFRVDRTPPLTDDPSPPDEQEPRPWKHLLKAYKLKHGKALAPIKHCGKRIPPAGCRCAHCDAPRKYLYINNGKLASQVRCKVCGKTSPTHGCRRESKATYWCPHCEYALYRWKSSKVCTIYKCPNDKCPQYLRKKGHLTDEEAQMRTQQKYDPNFKLHYQYREYHIDPKDLKPARPGDSPAVDLHKIHNNYHVVGLVLTFMINLGLSSRVTRNALKGLFDISISHQTVLNYVNAAAWQLADFVDKNSPPPSGTAAADETYIIVEKEWHYTWLLLDTKNRAICGHNLSNRRCTESALALLEDAYGPPSQELPVEAELITDGLPAYDNAVMAYNAKIPEPHQGITKRTVIGLKDIDPESEEYRAFKQMIERLNRTYKYHTRPRAGFKAFDGAVALTTLFVAYYNFMRPHSALRDAVPVKLDCLKGHKLMPEAWSILLKQAA